MFDTGNGTNFERWGRYDTLKVSEVASMMRGLDPDAVAAGRVVVDDEGHQPDLAHEERMLTSAVRLGRIQSIPPNSSSPNSDTHIDVDSLIPWLYRLGYDDLVNGLGGLPQTCAIPMVTGTDAQRRLADLRAMGGQATQVRGRGWKFSGIKGLVAAEKQAGKKRSDEKTIRADLKDAAQAEADAKSAGSPSPWPPAKA